MQRLFSGRSPCYSLPRPSRSQDDVKGGRGAQVRLGPDPVHSFRAGLSSQFGFSSVCWRPPPPPLLQACSCGMEEEERAQSKGRRARRKEKGEFRSQFGNIRKNYNYDFYE